MKTVWNSALGIVLAATVLVACRNDESPVSATVVPPPPVAEQRIDQDLVGTWVDASSMDALEFRTDGTWRPLYVYAMILHEYPLSYYDAEPGGRFATTDDSVCVLTTTNLTFSSPMLTSDTLTYAIGANDSTLTLLRDHRTIRGAYKRLAIGGMVR